jgi:hypothetical protein
VSRLKLTPRRPGRTEKKEGVRLWILVSLALWVVSIYPKPDPSPFRGEIPGTAYLSRPLISYGVAPSRPNLNHSNSV